MYFVQRINELFSTLRFQITLWITFVVLVLVLGMITGVREIEERARRYGYDDFLIETLEEVSDSVAAHEFEDKDKLYASLKEKVKAGEYRALFVQVFDDQQNLIWGSSNAAVTLAPPAFEALDRGPYDSRKHRVYEKRLHKLSGEVYYVRCGFLKLSLQEDIDLINRTMVWAGVFLVIFAPVGGYIIAMRATKPISQIIATAAHLEPANLKERLPIRGTGDEIDQLSRTINGMLDRLASFITQNRDFLANAAHELRSPLAAIRSSVEVGLNQSRTPEEYAAILSDVMEEISRLAGLVNRLLILAEADAGRLSIRDLSARLDKVVRESVEMFDAVADAAGIQLTIAELPTVIVRGDETNLRQVVRNLIDNAIKYNRNPGEVVVSLRADPVNREAILTVADSGIGIDNEVLPRIFERFYRIDKARSREKERLGYGLGLSICQTIIHSLHGSITVESEIGKGTIFTIRLPLGEESAILSQSGEQRFPASVGS